MKGLGHGPIWLMIDIDRVKRMDLVASRVVQNAYPIQPGGHIAPVELPGIMPARGEVLGTHAAGLGIDRLDPRTLPQGKRTLNRVLIPQDCRDIVCIARAKFVPRGPEVCVLYKYGGRVDTACGSAAEASIEHLAHSVGHDVDGGRHVSGQGCWPSEGDHGTCTEGYLRDLVIIRRDNDVREQFRGNGQVNRPGEKGAASEVSNVLSGDPLRSTTSRNDRQRQVTRGRIHHMGQTTGVPDSEWSSGRPAVGLEAHGSRATVFLDLDWWALPGLLRCVFTGRRAIDLRPSRRTGFHGLPGRLFKAIRAELEPPLELSIGSQSTDEPMLRAIERLDSCRFDVLAEAAALDFPHVPNAAAILRTGVLKEVATRNLPAFYAQQWAATSGIRDPNFYGATPWDALLLRRTFGPSELIQALVGALGAIYSRLRRSRSGSIQSPAGTAKAPRASAATSPRGDVTAVSESTGSVLYILNQSMRYGDLYAYDHVLSDDPLSILHPSNVIMVARTGGSANTEGITHGFPSSGSRARQLRVSLSVMARSLWKVRSTRGWRTAWELGRLVARANGQSRELAARFPSARLAILAYDLQVPSELVLALENLGIRTVALNERPQSLAVASQPLAVGTLLTASPTFSALAARNHSVSAARTQAVGMWRTDLIHQYRRERRHELAERADAMGCRFVVVLPYHLEMSSPSVNPLATAAWSVQHFIEGVLSLAALHSDVTFVFRSKNDSWLDDPRMQTTAERLAAQHNCLVSREYDRLNESYRLVACADLVIAKYTSLVDECLAVSIPSIIHDYTPIAHGVTRPIVPYLPSRLFAQQDQELQELVAWALESGGRDFRTWWEPHRREVFADMNDGEVRRRARGAMESLLDERI